MAAPFLPPGIKAKAATRGRIPVSDEERTAARAGMGGEKTAQAKQAAATTSPEPVAPVATESAASDVAPTQPAAPVAAELVAPVVEAAPVVATTADAAPTPEPTPAPTVATAPAAAPAPVTTAPTPAPRTESTPAPAVDTQPAAPTVTAAATAAPAAVATAPAKPAQPTATATPGRRGRKPSVAAGSTPVVLHSLKVPEPSWLEIKVVVAQLMAVEDVPHNIQTYIEAAHKHYEAYLRKQGKLPAK